MDFVIDSSFRLVSGQLGAFANLDDFWSLFDVAFGKNYDRIVAMRLRSQWQVGDFSNAPEIEVISSSILGNANGAYASSVNKIYLSDAFVENATTNSIAAVLLEEYGHFVDAQVNQGDTTGDEGELFSAMLRGVSISSTELSRIQAENDSAIIQLNNQSITIEQSTVALPADNRIASVLGGVKWGISTITYSFYSSGSYYGNETGLAPVSDAIQKSVRDFLEYVIEPLINVNFVEVSDSSSSYGLLRYFLSTSPSYAYAYYPYATDNNQGNSNDRAGDVFFNPSYDNLDDSNGFQGGLGTHGYVALIHETLHALGLKHPGDYNGDGSGDPPFLPFNQDNQDNTIMSYNFTSNSPGTPMPYDVLALQYLYGAKSFNGTNTNYTFSTVFGYTDGLKTVGNLTNSSPTKLTLWDSGGIDTLDFSNLSIDGSGYRFDINEGGWLTTQAAFNNDTYEARGDVSGNIYTLTSYGTRLAYGVQIEKAIGTISNDTFYGNSLDNSFTGRLGNDALFGGAGNDVAIYSGLRAQYQVSTNATGGFTITDFIANRDGADSLNGIEFIQFSDQTISLASNTLPTLIISDIVILEGDSGTKNAVFTITRSGTSSQPITVTYTTANGTALAGTDFVNITGTLNFATNETTKTITVVINGDTAVEADETFFVNLSNPVNAIIGDGQAEGIITNDDVALPVITVVATDASAAETATGITPNPGQFTLTRTGATTSALTVNLALSGTATNGTDYTNIPTTATFAIGSATAVVNLNVIDDTLVEVTETAILTVGTGTGYTVGTTPSATVNITDNDVALPVITVVATDASAAETATGITPNPGQFTLTRTGATTSALT
ncbi:MAG: Calx-beta domain-containing protein, partial [Pseudanabaena sp. ELA645]